MDVVALVLFVLLAIGLVGVSGFPAGLIMWLVCYGLFRWVCRALLHHVGH